MRRDGIIVSYTADELDDMIARGETQTDWGRVDAMTDEEIESNAAADDADRGEVIWEAAIPVSFHVGPKQQVTVRLDDDVLAWFKSHGRGYQTRINAVLRAYMESQSGEPRPDRQRNAF